MEWIKKNYDQFSLALLAFLLFAYSGWLIYCAISFPGIFDKVRTAPAPDNNVHALDTGGIQAATDSLTKPAAWSLPTDNRSPFVSTPYVVTPDGNIEDPRTGPPLHPPVPNRWILDHHLNILDNNVLNEDPDGDGFSNLDEWMGTKGDGSDATDPWDKNSHPPYWTKLRLGQYYKKPFRLMLMAWDGNPKKTDTLSFQINAQDTGEPSQFVHIGDMIAGTTYKIVSFVEKHQHNSASDAEDDVSELTILNTKNNNTLTLVLNHEVNDPDSYAIFKYLWNNTQIAVLKGKQFVLTPETTVLYKVIDIEDDHAVIETPAGQQITVPHL